MILSTQRGCASPESRWICFVPGWIFLVWARMAMLVVDSGVLENMPVDSTVYQGFSALVFPKQTPETRKRLRFVCQKGFVRF